MRAAEALQIKCATDHVPTQFAKDSERFEHIISMWKEHDDPMRIQCWKLSQALLIGC
jgi:hypothetical protein